jgi:transcriptional regulator with XRE-family HTH domain
VTPEILEEFGYQVRNTRIREGWTLEHLARIALGNPERKGYMSAVEKGKRALSPLTIGKIAHALDLPESVTAPLLKSPEVAEDDFTQQDRNAERLLRIRETDTEATPASEALLISLAYEFAKGTHAELISAYNGLRSALQEAEELKARGRLPSNTGDQVQAVMARVAELNDQGLRDEAGEELEQALERNQAERTTLREAALRQDRVRNDPKAAAARIVEGLREEARPEGLWQAVRDTLIDWRERGERLGQPFDMTVAMHLGDRNRQKTPKGQIGVAWADLGSCLSKLGERDTGTARLELALKAYQRAKKRLLGPARKTGRASNFILAEF